ncbi:MAG: PIN domain-containing protein [Bacteroidota bacterium]
MGKLFLDTNVMLDLLGERAPYYQSAAQIATLADKGQVKLVVSALSYATIFYLLSKYESSLLVKEKIRKFKILAETADLSDEIIEKGLVSKFTDFEDALQYHCALTAEATIIITRNEKDFKASALPVLKPDEYLKSRI